MKRRTFFTTAGISGCRRSRKPAFGQPIAQLIGGAPQPKYATFIQGTATATR